MKRLNDLWATECDVHGLAWTHRFRPSRVIVGNDPSPSPL
jgi:hypothetical protein